MCSFPHWTKGRYPVAFYLNAHQKWCGTPGVLGSFAIFQYFELQNSTTFSFFQLSNHFCKNNAMVKNPCLSTFLGPLWTLNPISVTAFSILSNKSLGECVDVNRIFLWATSCNESINHRSQVKCSYTQLWMCRYPDMLIGVMLGKLYMIYNNKKKNEGMKISTAWVV